MILAGPAAVKPAVTVTTKDLEGNARRTEVVVPCPVCGQSDFDDLLTPAEVEEERRWLADFYQARSGVEKDHTDFTQGESTFIVCCRTCGTVLRNPRPTADEVRRRYEGDRYGPEVLRDLLRGAREFYRDKARAFADSLPAGARILEVGSFVGAFLLAAKELGWDATGLDIGDETASFCRSMGLHVVNKDLAELVGVFDAVFVWNTFDQLATPRETLRQIRRLLGEDGLLVLRVPNGRFECGAVRLRRARPKSADRIRAAMAYNNFLTFPYLNGYTPESLEALLAQEGWDVQSVRGDTILPLNLGSPETRREELRTKRATMRVCRNSAEPSWPWMDVVAVPNSGTG